MVTEGVKMGILKAWLQFLRAMIMTRAGLAAENLALRQRLAVLSYSARRPKLRSRDRIFWVWLSRIWPEWRSVLTLVFGRDSLG
jgi:putative transposase